MKLPSGIEYDDYFIVRGQCTYSAGDVISKGKHLPLLKFRQNMVVVAIDDRSTPGANLLKYTVYLQVYRIADVIIEPEEEGTADDFDWENMTLPFRNREAHRRMNNWHEGSLRSGAANDPIRRELARHWFYFYQDLYRITALQIAMEDFDNVVVLPDSTE